MIVVGDPQSALSTWCASVCCKPAPRRASTCAAPTSRSSPTPSARWASSSARSSSPLTSWYWVDSVIAIGIGLFILPRAYKLGRDSLRILVESAPGPHRRRRTSPRDLEQLDGVVDAHDLHVWTITSGMDAVSVHLQVEAGYDTHAVLDRSRDVLRDRPPHQPRHRPGRARRPRGLQPRPVVTGQVGHAARRRRRRPGSNATSWASGRYPQAATGACTRPVRSRTSPSPARPCPAHRELVAALGAVKQAAARANADIGVLELATRADLIDRACEEIK